MCLCPGVTELLVTHRHREEDILSEVSVSVQGDINVRQGRAGNGERHHLLSGQEAFGWNRDSRR